jgi:hypothetical protein
VGAYHECRPPQAKSGEAWPGGSGWWLSIDRRLCGSIIIIDMVP